MKVGRRLAMKVLNASKFVLGATGLATDPSAAEAVRGYAVNEPLDVAMLGALDSVVAAATAALEAYDHTRALEVTESLFWTFCDDYVELVKDRAYDGAAPGEAIDPFAECSPAAASARATLVRALDVFLALFAPVLPFATEEVWSWYREGSVHRSAWPVGVPGEGAETLAAAGAALAALRKVKSEAKVSQRTVISSVTLTVPEAAQALVASARADLMAAGRVESLDLVGADVSEATASAAVLQDA
jgi:valyl-tRNA synthetase